MNADTFVLLACAICLAACGLYFIKHKDYDDGIVGNMALWAVCGVSALIVYSIVVRHERYELDNLTVVLLVAIPSKSRGSIATCTSMAAWLA